MIIYIPDHASKALYVVAVLFLKHHNTTSLIVLTIKMNAKNYLVPLTIFVSQITHFRLKYCYVVMYRYNGR